jgi:integrase
VEAGVSKRALNKLTDVKIRAFISKAKAGRATAKKLSDGGALYLTLTPAGTPVWRIKYRFGGKERLYAVGLYPSTGLEDARRDRDAVKGLLKEGRDPVQARKLSQAQGAEASENTFELVAAAWLAKRRKDWSGIHYEKSSRAFERDVLPRLGRLPIGEIKPAMVASVIEAIVNRGARDTALKVLQHVGGVFRLAQARGMRDDNPAEPVYEVLPGKQRRNRMPALLKFPALGDILRRAERANLSEAVNMAHRLCAFTAARIGNVVEAEWAEFDLQADVPVWVVPRRKMKSRDRDHDHKIILAPVIAKELRQWHQRSGSKRFVFPSPAGGKHITRESLEKAYRVTLGLAGAHSPHGWRSALSTLARDHGFERDAVELALDHIHDNDVVRAYDRGERLHQRVKLMTWWGDELTRAQRGADVTALKRATA